MRDKNSAINNDNVPSDVTASCDTVREGPYIAQPRIMGPPQMVANMFSQNFYNGGQEGDNRSLLRLPLQLVAIIIASVSSDGHHRQGLNEAVLIRCRSSSLQISPAYVERAAYFTT